MIYFSKGYRSVSTSNILVGGLSAYQVCSNDACLPCTVVAVRLYHEKSHERAVLAVAATTVAVSRLPLDYV
jgi:hypothetical protein